MLTPDIWFVASAVLSFRAAELRKKCVPEEDEKENDRLTRRFQYRKWSVS